MAEIAVRCTGCDDAQDVIRKKSQNAERQTEASSTKSTQLKRNNP